jgi:hypothetical protein
MNSSDRTQAEGSWSLRVMNRRLFRICAIWLAPLLALRAAPGRLHVVG